jgi:hypothetical protein
MENQENEAIENVAAETNEQPVEETGKLKVKRPKQFVKQNTEDDVIKVDLRQNKEEDAVQEQSTDAGNDTVEQPQNEGGSEEVVEEVRSAEQNEEQPVQDEEQPVLEEIIEEEVQEQTEQLTEDVAEAIAEQEETGVELPENIQKVVDFMNETGGTLEDYVRLNQDYSQLNETQLLREYYENTRPHLDKEEIDFLMEDNFAYDEDLDEERDIRKKKIAYKEELAKAKSHLDGLKSKYYEEIKAGSRLNPEQQKAVEFFNRYNKENAEASKIAEKQKQVFLNQTNNVFSNDFKGFDYQVGDKKYRFNVKNASEIKETQSDINNFVKKFLNDKNEMSDAKGYHKSLFTAMNADKIAQHFYEQGKADAMKESMARTKNVNMDARGVHEKVTSSNGWTVRSVNGQDTSKLKIKLRK